MADQFTADPPRSRLGTRRSRPVPSRAARRETRTAYLFIAPSAIGFIVFLLGPLVAALWFSLTEYDIISPPRFVGLDNYIRLFSDSRLGAVYVNTIIYVVAAVVLINGIGLLLAVLINQHMPRWLTYVFRSVYFFPSLVALAYIAIIWQALFQKDTGIVNYYLGFLGIEPVNWLNSSGMSRTSVIIVDVWRNVGFTMLIFVSALQEVPKELNEAAEIDGAGPITVFRRITVPMISQAIFFNVTITVIGAFQIYESVIVLTNGGPGDSTRSVVMYLAEKAFSDFDIGYASAISMTLFAVILAVTIVQFRVRRAWVHYEQ
ncbi:carbohydrate ABC transporter permease [Microbacterium sp. CIAB417]|uniref:carbohydrate ABC transporter permease n=1 Tax=Microbacterium sp. CIAB417 TaxID=2860287 RepID=UPI001FAD4B53|nr:sugar ABC transporter permease [Microbacterium sp. CIAB417]